MNLEKEHPPVDEITLDDITRKPLSDIKLKPIGQGHNASLLPAACECYRERYTAEETLAHLNELYDPERKNYGTAPKRAVDRAWDANGDMSNLVDDKAPLPAFQPSKLGSFKQTTKAEIEPTSPGDIKTGALAIIKKLFKNNDLICIEGSEDKTAKVVRVCDIKKINDSLKFLNPSVFKSTEINAGYHIPRNNDNVLERRYMVLERDIEATEKNGLTKDEAIADRERFNTFAMVVADFIPLVMAVDSGGKSVHFWFDRSKVKDAVFNEVFAIACEHGADPMMRVESLKARMPNVSGDGARRPQNVLYWDPSKVGSEWDVSGFEKEFGVTAFSDRFFYEGKKGYRFESGQGRYISQNVSDVRRRLRKAGIKPDDIGDQIDHIQESRDICYAGEISGKMAGFYELGGVRFLVTKSPNFIKPCEGKFPIIRAIIEGIFSKHETSKDATMQLDSFYGWLQCCVVSLQSGKEQHGQAMAFVGGVDCGKTFLQDYIITPCLGGRSAKAALFLQGGTNFNADLFRAEHLILSDEHMAKDMVARGKLAANLKKFTTSTHGEQLHSKGVDALAITPWWRVSISLNDRPENLLILPPLNDDFEDKIIILRACREKFPMLTNTPEEKQLLRAQIEKELPGFLWWLLNEYKIPKKRVCGRFGVDAWHNPEILKIIHKESEECQFLTLIDAHFWPSRVDDPDDFCIPEKWEGEALELKTQLCSGRFDTAQKSVERLLGTWANKPGVLLGKLEKVQSGRISSKLNNGKTIWTIYKPE